MSHIERGRTVCTVPKIQTYFAPVQLRHEGDSIEPQLLVESSPAPIQSLSESELEGAGTLTIDEALEKLAKITNVTHNQNHERRFNELTKFDFVRYIAIEHYLTFFKRTGQKVLASHQQLKLIFGREILLVMVEGFVIGLISTFLIKICQNTARDATSRFLV